MAKEIERKFMVSTTEYREMTVGKRRIAQGYLSNDADAVVRVRIADDHAYITVKGRNTGAVRDEWEYEIPVEDAKSMLRLCKGVVIDKIRYLVPYGGRMWEVDEFGGEHDGLVLAEVELDTADADIELPNFIGKEVTGDERYYNSNLSKSKQV